TSAHRAPHRPDLTGEWCGPCPRRHRACGCVPGHEGTGSHRGDAGSSLEDLALGLHDQWYKNAVIYCLDVKTYADSDGDGYGDFRGLTRRLDYLAGLGVTCLWLMPF